MRMVLLARFMLLHRPTIFFCTVITYLYLLRTTHFIVTFLEHLVNQFPLLTFRRLLLLATSEQA